MRLTTSFQDGKLVLYFDGELDHHAAKKAMEEIGRSIDLELPRECIMDLRKLSFMDSSGIAVILGTHKRIKQIDGKTSVINTQKQPMKVLAAAGVPKLVQIFGLESSNR